jgi:hypothetical protein
MGVAVHFNNQPRFPRVEVRDIRTDRVLATELNSKLLSSERLPEESLRIGHLLAQGACALEMLFGDMRPAALGVIRQSTLSTQHAVIARDPKRLRTPIVADANH